FSQRAGGRVDHVVQDPDGLGETSFLDEGLGVLVGFGQFPGGQSGGRGRVEGGVLRQGGRQRFGGRDHDRLGAGRDGAPVGTGGGGQGTGGKSLVRGEGFGSGQVGDEAFVDVLRGGGAVLGVLGEQVQGELFQVRGQPFQVRSGWEGHLSHVCDLELERRVVVGEHRTAGEHLVQDTSEGVQVAGGGGCQPAHLFGGHVGVCAQGCAGLGEAGDVGAQDGGDAEVQDLHRAVVGHHDVAGLEVTVHDGDCVRLGQDRADLGGHRRRGGARQGRGLIDGVGE